MAKETLEIVVFISSPQYYKHKCLNHRFCHTPLVCEGEGPVECKTVYESECETRYHEHQVEDDVVECETIQDEKCADVTQVRFFKSVVKTQYINVFFV